MKAILGNPTMITAYRDTFKPSTTNPSFARGCHGCHTANAKARDVVFTDYAKR